MTQADIAARIAELHAGIEARLLQWFAGADLWLTPTSPRLPPRVGEFKALTEQNPEAAFHKIAELGAFTALSHITGQPAISLPAGLSRDGVPIGAQLTGALQSEGLLLQVARQLEAGKRWPGPAGISDSGTKLG